MTKQHDHPDTSRPPMSLRFVNRVLIITVIVLALLSGYFHALWQNETYRTSRLRKANLQLEQDVSDLESRPQQPQEID